MTTPTDPASSALDSAAANTNANTIDGIPAPTQQMAEENVLTNVDPTSPPEMKTLVYSPDVRIYIARKNKQYDVSNDVVAWSIRRVENGVSSAVFRLSNKAIDASGKKLRYTQLFERMDRVVIWLKRIEWVQVFSGYLDSVPHVQLYPGTVNFRASCTLKRLMHTWWDPGLRASMAIFDQPSQAQREWARGEELLDMGLGSLLRRLLVLVGGWDSKNIHIQRFPIGFFQFMENQIKRMTPGDNANIEEFKKNLLGEGDTSLGPGRAASLQQGVSMGGYSIASPDRMMEVIRAVDEMGMGPNNTDLAAAQGIGVATTGSGDKNDKPAWEATQEVGVNWADAALKSDAAVHCFMTIAVESQWVMYANAAVPESLGYPHEALSVDGTSVGLYQQQNFGEWGTIGQRMNVKASTQMFLQHLQRLDWRNMDRGAACQAVQRSAFPEKYAAQEKWALDAVRAARGGTGTGMGTGGANNISASNPLTIIAPNGSSVSGAIPSLPGTSGTPIPSIPATNGGTPDATAVATQVGMPAYNTAGALSCARAQIGKPYVWGAEGPESFDCLVEGSLVATDRGEVPIEEVTTDDRVMTRKGFRKVLRAWKVRDDAEVVSVEVNGRMLTGTPDHRVWTENRGWVPLEGLTEFDTVLTCRTSGLSKYALNVARLSWAGPDTQIAAENVATKHRPKNELEWTETARQKEFFLTALPITGIQNLKTQDIENIFREKGRESIERYGKTLTVPYPRGMKCTTSTTTPTTTTCLISSLYRSPRTVGTGRRMISPALTAAPPSRRQNFKKMLGDSAPSSTSRSTITTPARQRRSVYDLTVEGEHEFFANGVLVHNCSGLMQFAYASIGLNIPRVTYDQVAGLQKIPFTNLVPGDLIFPAGAEHVVMYSGGNMIVEAQQTGVPVHEVPIWFDMASATCCHVPGAQYGGTPFAPFDITRAISKTGNVNAGAVTGGLGGSTGTGQTEPIARNLFTYQFFPGQFFNPVSQYFGGQPGGEEKAFINDEPLIQTVISFAQAGLRNFQSAPNGDFIAYYPDYFGLDGKDAVFALEDVEMKNVQIDLNDDAMATHVYIAGSMSLQASNNGIVGWMNSKGVATVENEWLFRRMTAAAPHVEGELFMSGKDIMARFGARPLSRTMTSVRSGPMEFLLAVELFMRKWAEQYATQIETTFMPEVFPGMRVHLVNHNLQVYVAEVTHAGDFENGFTTSMTIMAPSNPNIRRILTDIFKPTSEELSARQDLLRNAAEVPS